MVVVSPVHLYVTRDDRGQDNQTITRYKKSAKIDELDFVVWDRGWQDGWLCGHHKIDLFYKKYNQNTYFIFHHSICLNVSVCPNTDIYVSDIDCMYILFENVSEVDFLMSA